jgi:hypothetical protein
MHDPVPEVGQWLGSVLRGHLQYYGVPMNAPALLLFRFQQVKGAAANLSQASNEEDDKIINKQSWCFSKITRFEWIHQVYELARCCKLYGRSKEIIASALKTRSSQFFNENIMISNDVIQYHIKCFSAFKTKNRAVFDALFTSASWAALSLSGNKS